MIADFSAEENLFILQTALNEKDLAKQVPGASWEGHRPNDFTSGTGCWTVPVSWPAYVAINGIFAHTMQPTEHFRQWAHTVWEQRYGPLTNLRFQEDADLGTGPTVARLWPLQRGYPAIAWC